MNNDNFYKVVTDRQTAMRIVLNSKAGEYATDDDRLYSFKRAGELLRVSPARALLGMAAKHLVSVLDMVEERGVTESLIDEKIGDLINYLVLLEALLLEELKEGEGKDGSKIQP